MKKIVMTVLLASAALVPVAFAASPGVTPGTVATGTTSTSAGPAASATPPSSMSPVKTVPAELKDGTKLEITGNSVSVVGKDGSKTPAPDGNWEMKDGTKVTTQGGMVVK